MLVKLEMKKWGGRVRDRKVQAEVEQSKNARRGQISVTKRLIAEEHQKAYEKAYREMYAYHKSHTCRYTYAGWFVMNGAEWHDYSKVMSEQKLVVLEAVEYFLDNWEDIVVEAPGLLGDLYDPNEIPSREQITRKFSVNIYCKPFPKEADFYGMGLTNEEIQEQIQKQIEEGLAIAMADVWHRLYEKVKHLIDNIKKGDELKRWSQSMIDNIEKIIDILPALNVTNDPNLEKLAEEVRDSLCMYSVSALKDDEFVREAIIEKGETIMNKMEFFMGKLPIHNNEEEAA
jgi:hypothetical protein